ncbi:MAG: hypothetical protein ABSE73_00490 [Planctomycetota bacterium]
MTSEKLHDLYSARPFQRFIIHLADGREIPVPHPEWMMFMPGGRTVYVARPDTTVNLIDVFLITDLELRPAGNPKGRKRRIAGRT